MATEEHQPQAGHEILSKHSSSPSMGSRPLRDKAHTSPGQEVWRGCDQLWLSKQRSSPALLFYRKLSCESVNGVNSAEEYEEVLSTKDKLLAELSADMNYEGIKNILGDSDTDRTNCVSSDHSTSLNTNSDSRSSPSSCTSCLTKRHIRRGSLPVSMLAFCKVIKKKERTFCTILFMKGNEMTHSTMFYSSRHLTAPFLEALQVSQVRWRRLHVAPPVLNTGSISIKETCPHTASKMDSPVWRGSTGDPGVRNARWRNCSFHGPLQTP